ncbi:hypothetical protein A2U01_0062631, partial [Trifolium medium]|nr:hypothetical protein [Trifolium medium]
SFVLPNSLPPNTFSMSFPLVSDRFRGGGARSASLALWTVICQIVDVVTVDVVIRDCIVVRL